MRITNTQELRQAIRNPYAWPGGYQTIIILADGEVICHECARKNYELLSTSLRTQSPHNNDGWYPYAHEIHYEGPPVYCCNCDKEIPSAYGDHDDQEVRHD